MHAFHRIRWEWVVAGVSLALLLTGCPGGDGGGGGGGY